MLRQSNQRKDTTIENLAQSTVTLQADFIRQKEQLNNTIKEKDDKISSLIKAIEKST